MQTLLLTATLALGQTPTSEPPAPPAAVAPAPLAYRSEVLPFAWDRVIPLDWNVDGLKVIDIFFNKRVLEKGLLGLFKGAEFGTRAHVRVINTADKPRIPGFAVAVVDKDGRLLGVASGGTKLGVINPGETDSFDLNFTQVKERVPGGATFSLAVELRN